jgi:hypothetical protein
MEKITTIKPNQTVDPFALQYQFIDNVKKSVQEEIDQDDDPYCLQAEREDQMKADADELRDVDGFEVSRMHEEELL